MTSRYAQVYESPARPGHARPTTSRIVHDEGLEGKWNEKAILITGCPSGLGVETARTLAATGASLYLTARDIDKAKAAFGDLAQGDRVHLLQLDLNSLASVQAFITHFTSKTPNLSILIANVGVMMTPVGRTADGFETQFGTNHLAHFLLFQLLKPALLASSTAEFNSPVVTLSSIAHPSAEVNFDNLNLNGDYNPWIAYV